jgi:plasmid stabilization system protein ParE
MKTRLASAAAQDLAEILRFLSDQSPSAARGFRDKFREVRQLIGDYPKTGRQTDEPAIRYVNAGRYPYLVFFEIFETQIVIVRIIHGARDPNSMPAWPR